MKQSIRSSILNDPLLRKGHIHNNKPVHNSSIIKSGIQEYDEHGDDYCNDQTYSYKEKIKIKKQFN